MTRPFLDKPPRHQGTKSSDLHPPIYKWKNIAKLTALTPRPSDKIIGTMAVEAGDAQGVLMSREAGRPEQSEEVLNETRRGSTVSRERPRPRPHPVADNRARGGASTHLAQLNGTPRKDSHFIVFSWCLRVLVVNAFPRHSSLVPRPSRGRKAEGRAVMRFKSSWSESC